MTTATDQWPPKPTILQRVTSFLVALFIVATLTMLASMLSGCGTLAKNTKEKAVNTGGRVYGIRVDSSAGTAGNIAPSVVFGSAEWNYLSIPADTKNARVTVTSEEAGWFTNSIQAKRTCTIVLSESPLAEDRPAAEPAAAAPR